MPELPEVETIVRGLREVVVGKRIERVEVYWPRSIAEPDPAEFVARLEGQRIQGLDRRGKYVIGRLEHGDLLIHLRMTGQLLVAARGLDYDRQYLRVALVLDDARVHLCDVRKLGRLAWVPDGEVALASLGPEPLSGGFTAECLAAAAARRRVPVKALLLDQRVVAGIGNIYADEALHTAGIAPRRAACTLSSAELGALWSAVRQELERAIENRGTTLRDYRDVTGRAGEHREALRVYGRVGEPCLRCGARIARIAICGRSSYHCPACQH